MYPSYHAHIYYHDAATRKTAGRVREQLAKNFEVELGRWRDEPVGPHPQPMYQVAFRKGQFPRIIPWLMENRDGLTIFIHPNSGDGLGDHSFRALWMGKVLRLRLGMFKNRAKNRDKNRDKGRAGNKGGK